MSIKLKIIQGFTLGEVLITLGIIGIVAAMTLPGIIERYKKYEYSTRIKKFNTAFSQAILQIEAENDYEKKYKIVNFIQHFICVNCWNINYDENKLMWDKYADDKFGIAIRTNIDSLINAFKYTREEIYIGRIKYVDHSTFINEQSNPFSFAFLKDKELYAWENELRLISFVCKECEAFNKFNNIFVTR